MTDSIDTNPHTRRALFRSAGVAAAGIGMASIGTPLFAGGAKMARKSATTGSDVNVMQGALALEHEGIAAYRIAGGSGLLSKGVLDVALVFLGHHQGHRDSLAKLITMAGGKPVEPKTDAEYI